MDAAHDDQRRRFPIPASPLINFGALIALFGAIALLQHAANAGPFAPALPGPDRMAAVAAAPEVIPPPAGEIPVAAPAIAPVPAAVAVPAPASQMTVAAVAPPAPAEAADEEPAPTEAQPAPAPAQPQVAETRGAAVPSVAARPAAKARRTPAPPLLRVDEDRRFNIAELDNEAARQHYLAANRAGTAAADADASGKPTP